MAKTIKKTFSILTVLRMMMGVLSITAFATEGEPFPQAWSDGITVPAGSSETWYSSDNSTAGFNFIIIKQAKGAFVLSQNSLSPDEQDSLWLFALSKDGSLKNGIDGHIFVSGNSIKLSDYIPDGVTQNGGNYDATVTVSWGSSITVSGGSISHIDIGTIPAAPPVTPQIGSLTITKNVTGVGDSNADKALMQDYSVTVTYATGETAAITGFQYDTANSCWTASTTLTLDESTTYSVSEGSSPTLNGYTSPSAATISGGDNQDGTGTVEAGDADTVTLTNTYTTSSDPVTPQTGSLTITKNVTGVGDSDADKALMQDYSVTVTYAEGQSVTFAGDDFSYDSTTSRWTASTALALDESTTYSVSEGSIPTLNGYTSPSAVTVSGGDNDNGTGTVDAGDADTVTLVNAYTANGGGGGSETPSNPAPSTTITSEITDPQTPLGAVPLEPTVAAEPTVATEPTEPTEDIADEPVALASVPQTGDMSALWFALSGFSSVGLAGTYVLSKKRKDNSVQ